MRISFLLIAFFCLNACSTTKLEKNPLSDLHSCYDIPFAKELDKLMAEMDKHIERNNIGSFSDYLMYLKKGGIGEMKNYGASEKELGAYFVEISFKEQFCDFLYVEGGRNGKELTYEDYLANPRKVAIKKDFSHSKTFLKCLSNMRSTSPFVDDFLNMDMKATSPNQFISWIHEYQDKEGYNEHIAKQIIALDAYLLALEVIGSNFCGDCPD